MYGSTFPAYESGWIPTSETCAGAPRIALNHPCGRRCGSPYPQPMRRIAVLGSGRSGKTWLAARIGEELDLPVYGLDTLLVRDGREAVPDDDVEGRRRASGDGGGWVS